METADHLTRAQQITNGLLIEVDKSAALEASFRLPVALTAAAWADCVTWSQADTDRTGMYQDPEGRLWDVLWMARIAVRVAPVGELAWVRLVRIPRDWTPASEDQGSWHAELVAIRHLDDTGTEVVTIMLPDEADGAES